MAKKKIVIKNDDELAVAAIRSTCIDGINLANSGHPGTCLGAAPILYELYKDFLIANPFDSNWINRDRFVLSCGHASMLLYTILHLCSYDISIDDLKSFRKLGSKTPGHPEVGVTPGIDAGTGPLGQGIAQAVGLAIAETMLKTKYKDGGELFDHYTYCLCGDGCLEEGLSQEAISFAGLQKLNKLILLYDKNDITLDGKLSNSSNENVKKRFEACNWNVITCKKGNNLFAIKKAIQKARLSNEKPTLIIFNTVIGYGSKNEGTNKVHGSPLGFEDGNFAKENYGYEYPPFEIPEEVYEIFKQNFLKRGEIAYQKYNKKLQLFQEKDPFNYQKMLDLSINNIIPYLPETYLQMNEKTKESTRNSSHRVLNYFHENLTTFVGGSADVASSVKTNLNKGSNYSSKNFAGTNINWGIREFLMCSASNGILLHGGLRTYCGTFLVFSDYAKSAIRMSALMKIPQIYLFSHDSLAVGEDGPTHQPIEQLAMLRSIPNLYVFRPCDARETYASYRIALESKETPSALILSRQDLPLQTASSNYEGVKKGAYIIGKEKYNRPDFVIIATGSEVSLAMEIKNYLFSLGIDIRVISMPCVELFNEQTLEYQNSILGYDYSKRLVIELQSTLGWHKFAKYVVGIDEFGASGTYEDVIKSVNFTKEKISKLVLSLIKK